MINSQNPSDNDPLYFGSTINTWKKFGAQHTALEISQQPDLWESTWHLLKQQKKELSSFLQRAYSNADLEIILTGAGSSAFIGEILEGPFQKNTRRRTCAIATTSLLTHPQNHFNEEKTTLLISFARSGNSPESLAAVQLANSFCKKIYHLIITCSPSGKLIREGNDESTYIFLLPPGTNDEGLAMTGSFSSMLLAGVLISRIDHINELKSQLTRLMSYGRCIIDQYSDSLRDISKLKFERVVFLGSGPLYGAAMESHLKVQELTDGKVICTFDSFLGFRHGPKVVITPSTLLVYLFTNNSYAHQYELDLVQSINNGEKGLYQIGILEQANKSILGLDLRIVLSEDTETIDEDFLVVCSALPAQILGFFKSLQSGLQPDTPSQNGTITRVVEGVNIYPLPIPGEITINGLLI